MLYDVKSEAEGNGELCVVEVGAPLEESRSNFASLFNS